MLVDLQRDAVQLAGVVAAQVEGGFTQRLAGQGSGVDRRATRLRLAFHDRDALLEVRRLRRGFFARGTRTNDD